MKMTNALFYQGFLIKFVSKSPLRGTVSPHSGLHFQYLILI